MAGSTVLTADDVNLLVYRYLQESGAASPRPSQVYCLLFWSLARLLELHSTKFFFLVSRLPSLRIHVRLREPRQEEWGGYAARGFGFFYTERPPIHGAGGQPQRGEASAAHSEIWGASTDAF